MAYERRLPAVVVGPGKPGQLKVAVGRGEQQFVTDVSAELLGSSLTMPNSEFVAVVEGREVARVEPAGRAWLVIQDRIRVVLNRDWDPIGVANMVDDEYDMYIGRIYSLLVNGSSDRSIAEYLLSVETERMGLTATPLERLLEIASTLRTLELPPMTRK